jgi:protein-disulfide isomerase
MTCYPSTNCMAKRFGLAFLILGACGGSASPMASPVVPLAAAPAQGSARAAPPEDDAGVPIGPTDPTWGNRAAPVTIVEFADFECPFCVRAEPTLARIRESYGPDKVRIVWKNRPLPFHRNARPAAEAGAGVQALGGSDAFWRFRDLAIHNPNKLGEDAYVAWGQEAGIKDIEQFRAGLRSHAWASKVDADLSEAKDLGAEGTPWFFVNGIRLTGAQPFDAFKTLVDAQIVAAQAKVGSGTPPERVYALLSKDNRAAQPPEPDEEDDEPEDTKTVYKVPIGASPARGGPGALVTIVEFADYECPYCVRAESTLRDLRAAYGDTVRFVFRNEPLPFHPRAEPAAEAALEVRSEKGDVAFWSMHDSLLADGADLSDEGLLALAKGLGARADKVAMAMAKHLHKAEIDADRDVADDFQANGTPHFFIDGRRVVGAQPKEAFVAIIDEEIKKAQALVDSGTKRENLYDVLTKDGQAAPEPDRVEVAGLPADDPAKGSPGARVAVHEFADFQCPFCARAEVALKEVAEVYGDKVRLVWHDLPLPFHENALDAALAAREARTQRGDRGFWELHDTLFADDTKLTRGDLDADARALGLDMRKWAAALDGDAHKAEVAVDASAADKLGFKGTPSFVVVPAGSKSGYVIVGAQDYAKFHRLIDRALGEAHR